MLNYSDIKGYVTEDEALKILCDYGFHDEYFLNIFTKENNKNYKGYYTKNQIYNWLVVYVCIDGETIVYFPSNDRIENKGNQNAITSN